MARVLILLLVIMLKTMFMARVLILLLVIMLETMVMVLSS